MSNAEVENILKRIEASKGVVGSIVINQDGIPVRTSLDNTATVQYAGLLKQLSAMAISAVRNINPQDDMEFLRVGTKKHEIIVAPENNYTLIVIQNK